MKSQTEIVVIGGGIAGCSTLYHLTQEGITDCVLIEKGERSDGRTPEELRELSSEITVLPCVHGSALFARGETQALVLATLGPESETQDYDAITGGPSSKKFFLVSSLLRSFRQKLLVELFQASALRPIVRMFLRNLVKP